MSDPYALAVHSSFDEVEPRFHAALEASLDPGGPDALFDVVAGLGLEAGSVVLDAGCGRGRQSLELARRFGFDVLGVDPVNRHGPIDRQLAEQPLTAGSVRFAEGTFERLPVEDASVDLIFCRDSIMFGDLDVTATEFQRVLRPGGRGLAYLVLAGPLMSDPEAEHFAQLMHGRTLRPADIETALERNGLEVNDRIDYGGEWAERSQEQDGEPARRLLFASRLLRRPDHYIQQFGQDHYDIMLGDCLWHVYRMIGRLSGYACTFTRP
ncbi:MAG TPA: methyltransferase domain-containing protein [Aeromicrobium sp.]|nr:methyltransferase domain-containing protein [Aeromicrobium sp.]